MAFTLNWFRNRGKNNDASFARRLRLESLESRELLAAWTVNTTADDASYDTASHTGSLRGVIGAAAVGDTINFDSTVFAADNNAKITLTQGQIGISNKTLTISVSSGYAVTLDGGHTTGTTGSRIFSLSSYARLTLDGLTIQNCYNATGSSGTVSGGAIVADDLSRLTVKNSSFLNNGTIGHGGAIFFGSGAVWIEDSYFENNKANASGGVILRRLLQRLPRELNGDQFRFFRQYGQQRRSDGGDDGHCECCRLHVYRQ